MISIFTTSGFTDLYALFQGTGIAVPMTEGTGLDAGWYFVDNDDLTEAELPAGTHQGAILHGDWENPDPADPPEGTFDSFVWDGTVGIDQYNSLSEALVSVADQVNTGFFDIREGVTSLDDKIGVPVVTIAADIGDIPTAATNASAVRTELTTELGRVDAAISTRLATGSYTAPPSASTVADAVAAQSDIADALTTIATNLDEKVSEGGGGGDGGTVIPVNQVPVPSDRTWVLKSSPNGLVGEVQITRTVGENQPFAIDFRADLPANGRLVSLDEIEILSGPDGGIEISDAEEDQGVDRSQAKIKIDLVTVGKYKIGIEVTYDGSDGGGTAYGVVTLIARAT